MNITLINGYRSKSSNFYLFIGILLLLNLPVSPAAQTTFTKNEIPSKSKSHIIEERFIKINGIDQWVPVRGDRSGQVFTANKKLKVFRSFSVPYKSVFLISIRKRQLFGFFYIKIGWVSIAAQVIDQSW